MPYVFYFHCNILIEESQKFLVVSLSSLVSFSLIVIFELEKVKTNI
jgi:hypothetical protein